MGEELHDPESYENSMYHGPFLYNKHTEIATSLSMAREMTS